MGWKNWSYWLKGGLITISIIAVLFLIYYSIPQDIGRVRTGNGNIFSLLFDIIALLHFPLRPLYNLGFLGNWIVTLILLFVFYFIIGVLIGFIYGKIKERKND